MTQPPWPYAAALGRNPILAVFGDSMLQRFAETAATVPLAAGETLFSRGAPADRLFLIVEGRVELLIDDETGNRTRIEMVAPPRLAGMSCALDGTYAYSCEGSSPQATAIAISAVEFVAELGRNPAAAKATLAATSLQLRRLVGQLSDLKLKDSVQRLAGYLIELTPERKGAAEILLPSEKRAVADRLGMKPETLSRALARLDALGLVQSLGAATLRVSNLSSLRHIYLAGEEGARL